MGERDALDMAEGLLSQAALMINSYRLSGCTDKDQLHEGLLFVEQVQGILVGRLELAYAHG